MKPISVDIVPASPDFFTVYDFSESKMLGIGEPVIAWRIATYSKDDDDELFSLCQPLTADGDAGSNCIGVQNPNMTVTVFAEADYDSIDELQNDRYPQK